MLFSIENRDDLEKLKELVSLQNQLKAIKIYDELGKQNSNDEEMEIVFEAVTKTFKDVSEDVTKSMTESCCTGNNKALSKSNDKHLELMIDMGILASFCCLFYLKSPNPNIKAKLN